MTNYEKLELAKKLLNEVLDTWCDDEIKEYGSEYSFDELVSEISTITLEKVDDKPMEKLMEKLAKVGVDAFNNRYKKS